MVPIYTVKSHRKRKRFKLQPALDTSSDEDPSTKVRQSSKHSETQKRRKTTTSTHCRPVDVQVPEVKSAPGPLAPDTVSTTTPIRSTTPTLPYAFLSDISTISATLIHTPTPSFLPQSIGTLPDNPGPHELYPVANMPNTSPDLPCANTINDIAQDTTLDPHTHRADSPFLDYFDPPPLPLHLPHVSNDPPPSLPLPQSTAHATQPDHPQDLHASSGPENNHDDLHATFGPDLNGDLHAIFGPDLPLASSPSPSATVTHATQPDHPQDLHASSGPENNHDDLHAIFGPDLPLASSPSPSATVTQAPRQEIVLEQTPFAPEVVETSTTTWFWRPLMMLAAWLHLQHGLSHKGVGLFLNIIKITLIAIGVLTRKDDSPTDLRTAFTRLNLHDKFSVAPTCPTCRCVFPSDSPDDLQCNICNISLFSGEKYSSFGIPIHNDAIGTTWKRKTGNKKSRKPILQSPIRLPSHLIAEIINSTETMEHDLDKWRGIPLEHGVLKSIQDGNVWKTIPGPILDGPVFFDNTPDRPNPEELRIGVTLGFDG